MKNKKYKLRVVLRDGDDLTIQNFSVERKYLGLFWVKVSDWFFIRIEGFENAKNRAINFMDNYCTFQNKKRKTIIKKTVICNCEERM